MFSAGPITLQEAAILNEMLAELAALKAGRHLDVVAPLQKVEHAETHSVYFDESGLVDALADTIRPGPPGRDGDDGEASYIPGPPGTPGTDGAPGYPIPGRDGDDGEMLVIVKKDSCCGVRVTNTSMSSGTYNDQTVPPDTDLWVVTSTGGPIVFTGLQLSNCTQFELRNGAARPASGAAPDTITLLHQNSGSTSTNRVQTPDAAPLIVQPTETIKLKHDGSRIVPGERPPQPPYPGLGTVGGGSPGPRQPVITDSGSSYRPTMSDLGGLINRTSSGTMSDPFPVYPSGWYVDYQNNGSSTATITPESGTINGSGSLTVAPGDGARITSDGTDLHAQTGGAGKGSSGEASGTATAITPSTETILDVSGLFVVGVSRIKVTTATSSANPLNVIWKFYDEFGLIAQQTGACFTSPSDQRFQGYEIPRTVGASASVYNAPCTRVTVQLWMEVGTPPLSYEHTWAFR